MRYTTMTAFPVNGDKAGRPKMADTKRNTGMVTRLNGTSVAKKCLVLADLMKFMTNSPNWRKRDEAK